MNRSELQSPRRPFWRAVASHLACLGLTVLVAALLAAAMVRMAPGFGLDERQLDTRLSEESRQAIEAEYGGSANVIRYFWNYLGGLVRGDLGQSVSLGRPVREVIADRMGVTFQSAAAGLAWAWFTAAVVAFGLGLIRRRGFDWAATALAGALLCLPAALVGLFSFCLGASPALAIGAILLPRIFRYIRNVTCSTEARPHVLAARARGVGRIGLLIRHIWLPAAPELVALGAVSVSMAMGAAIPVEALCDSPGVGQLVWKAALSRDLPVLVNITVLIATVTAGANMVADAVRTTLRSEA